MLSESFSEPLACEIGLIAVLFFHLKSINNMKRVFNLLVSIILLAGFSACNRDNSGNQQQVPENPNPVPVPTVNYKGLTFISSGKSTVCLTKVGAPDEITLEYSTDESQWNPYTIGEKIALADGTFLLFRAGEQKNLKFSKDTRNYYHFEISGPISAQGSIMSLLDRDFSTTLPEECAFYSLFNGCTSLLSAPELPATTLALYCYMSMFKGCSALTSAPELPATTLALFCYKSMFEGCSALTSAPELPATTLADACYAAMFSECTGLKSAPELPAKVATRDCYLSMFSGCSALTSAPELPATKIDQYCYKRMFEQCTGLTDAPKLPATSLASFCYSNMFEGCTSLTSAPELPATELVDACYNFMFKDCSKLQYVKALFTTKPSEDTTKEWLSGVAPSGTFIKNKNATWNVTGAHGIPEGWKVETE